MVLVVGNMSQLCQTDKTDKFEELNIEKKKKSTTGLLDTSKAAVKTRESCSPKRQINPSGSRQEF